MVVFVLAYLMQNVQIWSGVVWIKASKGSVSSDEICINGCSQYTYNGVQSDLGIL